MSAENQAEFLKMIATSALMPLPRSPEPWRDPKVYEARGLVGGKVSSTTQMGLFASLRDLSRWDYLLVDIEEGRFWLVSRLFIFSLLLKRVRGLHCVVVVQTANDLSRKLLGIAAPDQLGQVLAARFPWFEEALVEAFRAAGVPLFCAQMTLAQGQTALGKFIERNQTAEDRSRDQEWTKLGDGDWPTWERTPWLDAKLVVEAVAPAFYDLHESAVQKSSTMSDLSLYAAMMQCQRPYVAVVNDKGEFLEAYERQAVVERIAAAMNASISVPMSNEPPGRRAR